MREFLASLFILAVTLTIALFGSGVAATMGQVSWEAVALFTQTAAVLAAASIGFLGVIRWKNERIEARQAELAEKALALMYRAPEIFDVVRSPMSLAGEGSSREREDGESDVQRRERDYKFVPFERLNNNREFFKELIEVRPSLKAIYGPGVEAPLEVVLKVRSEVISAARMLMNRDSDDLVGLPQEARERDQDLRRKLEAVIWSGMSEVGNGASDGPDFIQKRLNDAVADMESRISPLLKSRLHK